MWSWFPWTVLSESLNSGKKSLGASRASVVLSSAVKERTVLYVVRARHVIEDKRTGSHLVAEEVLVQGVCGMERKFIDQWASLDLPARHRRSGRGGRHENHYVSGIRFCIDHGNGAGD